VLTDWISGEEARNRWRVPNKVAADWLALSARPLRANPAYVLPSLSACYDSTGAKMASFNRRVSSTRYIICVAAANGVSMGWLLRLVTGGPTGGTGPPTVLEFSVINFSVCLVLLSRPNCYIII